MDPATAEQLVEGQRQTWAAGDWPAFAPIIQDVADSVVETLGVGAEHDFLDVATGSGNAAFAAAQRGARVAGLDLVPELIDAARARFAGAGLDADLRVGNAEELPFDDDSFDRVVSIFGVMFAPRHQMAADELIRVARPGARIAVTAWTPEGDNGRMFKLLGEYMPPPPDGFVPPIMWGNEEYVRGLFSVSGLEVECRRRMATIEFESAARWMEHLEEHVGPIIMAKAVLEPEGRWEAARAALMEHDQQANEADDGSMRARVEYLMTEAELAT